MIGLKRAASISKRLDNNRPAKKVLIVAGEASGDLHGAKLVKAVKRLEAGISFYGIGGPKMAEAGVEILLPASRLAVVGLSEVLSKSSVLVSARLKLNRLLKHNPPDLLILIDYPGFNLGLARKAKKYDLKVLYYISPQIWAWRRERLKKIARVVDRMAVILPFEKAFYHHNGLEVDYVGHPLMDDMAGDKTKEEEGRGDSASGNGPFIAILPGSRTQEVKRLLPVMIQTLERVSSRYPQMKLILPLSTAINEELVAVVKPYLKDSFLEIPIVRQDLNRALKGCDLALVASGTATLETAIMGVPMIIVYRVSPLSAWIGKKVIRVPHIGLVNLVAEKEVVPELVQKEVTTSRLADEMLSILQDRQRKANISRDLNEVKERLGGPGASEKTARIALDMIYDRQEQGQAGGARKATD